MKRLVVGALTVALLGACSASTTSTKQPEDEFLDTVETTCRDADKSVEKLDKTAASAPSDLYDILSDTSEQLDGLDAPATLRTDFERYTSNVDDQLSQLQKIVVAVAAGDTSAKDAAVGALNTLRSDNDGLVDKLNIYSCLSLVPPNGLTGAIDTVDTTVDTTADTTPVTDSTTPPTDATTPPTEPTTPATEATNADTTTATTLLPSDLAIDGVAPAGYTWVDYSPPDVSGLYENAAIGQLVTYYAGGKLESAADGSTSTVYVIRLSVDFTESHTKAYQYWEAVENGTDVTTPGGLTVHQELGAFTDTDCAVYVAGARGVTICTYTGIDGLTLMDQYLAANPN